MLSGIRKITKISEVKLIAFITKTLKEIRSKF